MVQVGDQLDRGDQEVEILYFLERLQREAAAAGGALHILNGNHETMNVAGQFRYATSGGVSEFLRWHIVQSIGAGMKVRRRKPPQLPDPSRRAASTCSAPRIALVVACSRLCFGIAAALLSEKHQLCFR